MHCFGLEHYFQQQNITVSRILGKCDIIPTEEQAHGWCVHNYKGNRRPVYVANWYSGMATSTYYN